MIEAVNSVIASSSLLRGNAEQVSSAGAFASSPNRAQTPARSAPQEPLISPFPFVFVDVNFDTAVLQFRDSTGNVVEQIPSQSRLEAQQRSQAEITQTSVETLASAPPQAQVEAAAVQQTVSAEAQAAAQAFSAAAQTSVQTTSGDVSVFA